LLVCDLFDYKKKLPFEILQNAVLKKPAKLEELTLLEVSLWLVLAYFRNGNFLEFRYWRAGKFSNFRTGIPGGSSHYVKYPAGWKTARNLVS